ncbi:MAG: hypothetical protein MJ158_04140 [Alphaproteobacteria bacterium]|nr:hypothetical protein [Alphaproteobacteria bacterium]
MKRQVNVIERNGEKTVAKKTSFITTTKRVFTVLSLLWIVFVAWFPLYVKNNYSGPIKKSIVVSMFFDLQRNINEQYEKLLNGIKKSVNLEKPVAFAIDKVKMAENAVEKVNTVTEKASEKTAQAKDTTSKAKKITGLANKFGIKTDSVDSAIQKTDKVINTADKGIATVDNTAKMVNQKVDKIEKDLTKVAQTEFDKMIDSAIKDVLDKQTGGLGTTLLTNYGIKHVYPWRPSSWGVATKIYNDLEKSDVKVIKTITASVNEYFSYGAWGLVIAAWLVGLIVWLSAFKKMKALIAPFLVCPHCGHTFADKRTAMGLLKVLQPWTWF